jgi:uncharacterized membrane protein
MHFIPWMVLAVQAGIVLASLLGYGIFASRPDLLMQVDPQRRFLTWALMGFAVGNILFGGLAVVAEALLRNGLKALGAFAAVYLVSLGGELMGTGWGVPFGPYAYTTLLGPKLFGLVPLLIPVSWFAVSWASWVIARQRTSGIRAILCGTALLIAWDLLLDPAMSKVNHYWFWREVGSYYGMPLLNLFGWGVTGLVLFLILSKMAAEPKSTVSFAVWAYSINFALPLGFCILNQYWLAVFAGIGSVAIAWIIAHLELQFSPRRFSVIFRR